MTSKARWKNIEYEKVNDGFLLFLKDYTILATTGRRWVYYENSNKANTNT